MIYGTDSYKVGHWPMYPPGTTKVYSYLESRGGQFKKTVFFGLQGLLNTVNFPEISQLEKAAKFYSKHFGDSNVFNEEGWKKLIDLGYFPIRIKAVREGSVVPTGNVLMTVENTHPDFYWLTNWFETMLVRVWYPITVATNSFYSKRLIKDMLEKTGCSLVGLPFKLHDFGYRGVSSEETAAIGGAANLTSFLGTDTIAGIKYLQKNYDADMPGFSVAATEHSVMTSWGPDKERELVHHLLDTFPTGIISVVADSYNVFDFARMLGEPEIKRRILERDGVFVVRPDSGDPVEVNSMLVDILYDNFPGGFTSKHYRLLNDKIRILQGDGIDYQMIKTILETMAAKGYAADNWVFGSGGALLQNWTRDTQKFAFKASFIEVNGEERDVRKNPITSSSKQSKPGRLKLHRANKQYITFSSANFSRPQFEGYNDELEVVYENGEITRRQGIEEIREIIESNL